MPTNAAETIQSIRTFALGEFITFEWLTDPIADLFEADEENEDCQVGTKKHGLRSTRQGNI